MVSHCYCQRPETILVLSLTIKLQLLLYKGFSGNPSSKFLNIFWKLAIKYGIKDKSDIYSFKEINLSLARGETLKV